jgi:hypothetical protein
VDIVLAVLNEKCQQYKQEVLGQHTRSKQAKKCQQYKQEALGQHTRSKQTKKCQQYKQEVLGQHTRSKQFFLCISLTFFGCFERVCCPSTSCLYC